MKLQTKKRGKTRTLARGRTEIAPGSDARNLKLKLTRRGRKELKDAPRRGLRVKAVVAVKERYTDRAGEATERLRLR